MAGLETCQGMHQLIWGRLALAQLQTLVWHVLAGMWSCYSISSSCCRAKPAAMLFLHLRHRW